MKHEFESRIFSGSQVRASQDDQMALTGYAATYDVLSHDLGGFRERIASTAFDRALREKQDVRFLFNHDPSKILGRVSAGTLQLSSDSKGLLFRCQLDPNQQSHSDLWNSVRRQDCTECSFAFTIHNGGESWDDHTDANGQRFARRTLTDVDLLDCSIVSFPAYPNTSVAARNLTRNARQLLSHEAWKRLMQKRAAALGRRIADDNVRDAVVRSLRTGWKQIWIGPGVADVRFEPMSEQEHTQHLRNRAAALGEEIRQQLAEADREDPLGGYRWDWRQGVHVPAAKLSTKF